MKSIGGLEIQSLGLDITVTGYRLHFSITDYRFTEIFHTLTQANKDICLPTQTYRRLGPLIQCLPSVWLIKSAPLPSPRPGAAAVTDGEGERCELNVTQWLTAAGMDQRHRQRHEQIFLAFSCSLLFSVFTRSAVTCIWPISLRPLNVGLLLF